ncbi:hypothetical protein H0I25_10260 [Cellulophaga sp. HaHa_2_95]|uniref:hypothetical protein n=1 Tax=Cellulophaga sp. HaHa_2_95 TaxID=2745558 RepID=UPI001C4FCF2D|nr:hypothetical protein [Cellulophaga sp. HaHa_2_95]QXP54474.1 hypothetical protein H0I25_10260 [Cellulophaga sp. HaHa_2_95]
MNKTTTVYQDAIRLLYILVNGSENFKDESNSKVKGIFRGKARLYAMDFWVRYPDYFAFELIKKHEETSDHKFLKLAESIFNNNEPDLRRIPMIRFLFGAYEKLDNTLSILISKGLLRQEGSKKENIHQYDFLIFEDAYDLIDRASKEFHILKWYDDRTKIINEIAGQRGGRALKERQYEQLVYAQTKLGGIIPSIKEDVLIKLEQLMTKI